MYSSSLLSSAFQLLLDFSASEPLFDQSSLNWSNVVDALEPMDADGDVEISPGGSAGGSVRIGVGHGLKGVGRRAARRIIAGTFEAIAAAAARGI